MDEQPEQLLTWDDAFMLARLLRQRHPGVRLEDVSLVMIYTWVLALPEFGDAPESVDDDILMSIYQEWFEEAYLL